MRFGSENPEKTQPNADPWSKDAKIGDGIARVGKVLIKYSYDSNNPVAQTFEGLSRNEQVLTFATDFPWQNRMGNLADRVRKKFIDGKKEKLNELVQRIDSKYDGSFAKIENIKVELYNNKAIENTALTALVVTITVKGRDRFHKGSDASSDDIKQLFDDMLAENWGFEENKIMPDTVSISETFKSDFGIDIFSRTGFISSGAPSGARLPQYAETVAECAKQCNDLGRECRAFFWTPNQDRLCHLRRNWLGTLRTYKELDQYAGIRRSSARPGHSSPDWAPDASFPTNIYTKQCKGSVHEKTAINTRPPGSNIENLK